MKKIHLLKGACFAGALLCATQAGAVQFAYCMGGLDGGDLECFEHSEYGDKLVLVEKSIGEMYKKNWRMIAVRAIGQQNKSPLEQSYFYFERP